MTNVLAARGRPILFCRVGICRCFALVFIIVIIHSGNRFVILWTFGFALNPSLVVPYDILVRHPRNGCHLSAELSVLDSSKPSKSSGFGFQDNFLDGIYHRFQCVRAQANGFDRHGPDTNKHNIDVLSTNTAAREGKKH